MEESISLSELVDKWLHYASLALVRVWFADWCL